MQHESVIRAEGLRTLRPRYTRIEATGKRGSGSYGFGLVAGLGAEGVLDRVAGAAGPPELAASTGYAAS